MYFASLPIRLHRLARKCSIKCEDQLKFNNTASSLSPNASPHSCINPTCDHNRGSKVSGNSTSHRKAPTSIKLPVRRKVGNAIPNTWEVKANRESDRIDLCLPRDVAERNSNARQTLSTPSMVRHTFHKCIRRPNPKPVPKSKSKSESPTMNDFFCNSQSNNRQTLLRIQIYMSY
jgi:hypothetical protein